MTVRAKFRVASFTTSMGIKETRDPDGTRHTENVELRVLKLQPVTSGSPENQEFYAYTPGGLIELSTLNPEAWAQFELNHEYYVDFTAAPV